MTKQKEEEEKKKDEIVTLFQFAICWKKNT